MKWSKRFKKPISNDFKDYTFSISKDIRLFKQEKKSILAHIYMLYKIKVINKYEKEKIISNLKKINKKDLDKKSEDIHFALEKELKKKIGKISSKIRISRSRNDLSTNCLKLWVLEKNNFIVKKIKLFLKDIVFLSEKHFDTIMPSFTHSHIAQPITLGHYLLSLCEMFLRDSLRLKKISKINNFMPLGSCAISGTNLKTNRNIMKDILGYKEISRNSIDAVSDRDYVIDSIYCYSQIMIHISRICEDFINWSNKIYNFIDISDSYSSGSSLMPQKKNPDVFEVARSRSGIVIGNLFSILFIIKSLPMGYNKDLQEDKSLLFSSYDVLIKTINILKKIFNKITFNKKEMYKKSKMDFSNSTDISEFLSYKGMPYCDAYDVVSNSVLKSLNNNKNLIKNVLIFLKKKNNNFYLMFKNKIKKFKNFKNLIYMKKSLGSTNPFFVIRECKLMKRKIKKL
ncbi:argininosuccinate lyase [Candidatus Vidania fulgoroideorum]